MRKARIILRNLSYKVSEQQLIDEFGKYGTIKECNLLKRENGKLVGCAFIQYEKVNHAAKAIHHANNKEFLGRPIILDWAVNRKKFTQHLKQIKNANANIKKEENGTNIETTIKQESDAEDENDESANESYNSEDDGDSEHNENDSDDNQSTDDKKTKPIHKRSNDVAEGCTVFIKNIPFEANNLDLFKVCRQFGPLYYAVITVDHTSGHSKGTGFVKYRVIILIVIISVFMILLIFLIHFF